MPHHQQKQLRDEGGCDRLSHLPDSLLVSILTHLPIKQSARSAVLAKRWRHLWLSITNLHLDAYLGLDPPTEAAAAAAAAAETQQWVSSDFPGFDSNRWLGAAAHIFRLHHHHPILSCTITVGIFADHSPLFDSFLYFLCNEASAIRGLFLLNIPNLDSFYHLPTQVFFCTSLHTLFLTWCDMSPPPRFSGLRALASLNLCNSSLTDNDLDLLIASCGALKNLRIDCCYGLSNVVIRAPKLRRLCLRLFMPLDGISLESVLCLSKCSVSIWCLLGTSHDVAVAVADGTARNKVKDLLMGLGHVEYLELDCTRLFDDQEPVVVESVQLPHCLPSGRLLLNLRKLRVHMSLADEDLIPILSCMLCSSPNLQELHVDDDVDGRVSFINSGYWETHPAAECMKHHLSIVQLGCIPHCEIVIGFIKFLLMNSCVLKKMKITYHEDPAHPVSIENDLMHIPRASDHLTLQFQTYWE